MMQARPRNWGAGTKTYTTEPVGYFSRTMHSSGTIGSMSHQIAPRHSNAAFFLATPKMRKNETNCGKVSPGGWGAVGFGLAAVESVAASVVALTCGVFVVGGFGWL